MSDETADKTIEALKKINGTQLSRLVHYDMIMTSIRSTMQSAMTDLEKLTAISVLLKQNK